MSELNVEPDSDRWPHLRVEDGTVYFSNGVDLGEVYMEVDGYYVWVPSRSSNGCWEAFVLRELANLLDGINEAWDTLVRNDPALGGPVA